MALRYTYYMAHRTTILLNEETRQAARELALIYGCSTSDAIRRSVKYHRDVVFGIPAEGRRKRVLVLEKLIDLFEGNDASEEITQLKKQDLEF